MTNFNLDISFDMQLCKVKMEIFYMADNQLFGPTSIQKKTPNLICLPDLWKASQFV